MPISIFSILDGCCPKTSSFLQFIIVNVSLSRARSTLDCAIGKKNIDKCHFILTIVSLGYNVINQVRELAKKVVGMITQNFACALDFENEESSVEASKATGSIGLHAITPAEYVLTIITQKGTPWSDFEVTLPILFGNSAMTICEPF